MPKKRESIDEMIDAQRATAATNALDHDADTAKVQEWLGHATIEGCLPKPAKSNGFLWITFQSGHSRR